MAKNALQLMSSDINVGLNEVVSVFVAKYEDALFAKKDGIADSIKKIKATRDQFQTELVDSVDKKKYEITIDVIGVRSSVQEVQLHTDFDKKGRKHKCALFVRVKLENTAKNDDIDDDDDDFSYMSAGGDLRKTVIVRLNKKQVDRLVLFHEQLQDLEAQMIEVMGLIKSVSRKERQIRGRISEMKLEQSGYKELLDSPEMLKLVDLK